MRQWVRLPAMPLLAVPGLAVLLALPARAEERPLMVPSRDVSVTYRPLGRQLPDSPAGTTLFRLSWLAAEHKLRMDLPGGAGWSVTDMASRRTFTVLEAQRVVMEMPSSSGRFGPLPQDNPNLRFTRGDTETIAGHECVVWRYTDGQNNGEACLTMDGVMLRSRGTYEGHSGGLEATELAYAPQDPARFRAPAGYRSMTMPAIPQDGGAGRGAAPGR